MDNKSKYEQEASRSLLYAKLTDTRKEGPWALSIQSVAEVIADAWAREEVCSLIDCLETELATRYPDNG